MECVSRFCLPYPISFHAQIGGIPYILATLPMCGVLYFLHMVVHTIHTFQGFILLPLSFKSNQGDSNLCCCTVALKKINKVSYKYVSRSFSTDLNHSLDIIEKQRCAINYELKQIIEDKLLY